MKLFKTILITLLSAFLLVSCIGDDYSICVRSYTLRFDYPAFPDYIHKVNVGIFDADGMFVTSQEVDKQALSSFQGAKFNLTGGNYTAVCWGNAFDHTQIDGLADATHISAGMLAHPHHYTSQPIPANDSLYYGKLSFAIPEIKHELEDTVRFVPAHITLQIQVKGLSNTATGTPPADYPFVRINNLLPTYDFDMQTLGNPVCYYPTIAVEPADKLATSWVDVLRFDNDTPATIDVVENAHTKKILYTLNLRDFMLANSIDIVHGQKVTIPIFISFFDGNVTVTLSGWGGTPIDPEL